VSKLRVLVVLSNYPTLSQTYKENELRALLPYCELRVVTLGSSDHPHREHLPFTTIATVPEAQREIDEFKPDIIHGHYAHMVKRLSELAAMADRPWTVRTHSFDLMRVSPEAVRVYTEYMSRSDCLGVLCFPFLRQRLLRGGLNESKLFNCWPVVDYARFYDPTPNGEDVLNTGACLPKKNMESFIQLASMVPERRFNLYPIGYLTDEIEAYNKAQGSPVHMFDTVEPHDMPAVFKRHQWLVYSANPEVPTIGWPMAIAEAQASGVGVLIQRIRPDIETYVGLGGYVFDSLEEAAEILRKPCPPEIREAGFRQARRSDVSRHIHLLLNLWAKGSPRAAELAKQLKTLPEPA
jgi:hypothetical protein